MRSAAVAGSFYPNSSRQISEQIDHLLQSVSSEKYSKKTRGLISPHAGYVYSGRVASFGFKSIADQSYKTIVILGPSHYFRFSGVSVFEGRSYETPMGSCPVDVVLAKKIRSFGHRLGSKPKAHVPEHAIEVQVPFLQKLFPRSEFAIVPILFGDTEMATISEVAEAVLACCDKEETLVIASSDFSHFFDYQKANMMDNRAIDLILADDMKTLEFESKSRKIEMCGYSAIVALSKIMASWGANDITKLCYANSGGVSGDLSRVVGYCSLAYAQS
jgi:AmmeMemoRadiSam system protein B